MLEPMWAKSVKRTNTVGQRIGSNVDAATGTEMIPKACAEGNQQRGNNKYNERYGKLPFVFDQKRYFFGKVQPVCTLQCYDR